VIENKPRAPNIFFENLSGGRISTGSNFPPAYLLFTQIIFYLCKRSFFLRLPSIAYFP